MQGCAAFTGSRALQERAPPAAWQSRVKLCSQLQFADVGFAEVLKLRVGPFSGAARLAAQRLPQPSLSCYAQFPMGLGMARFWAGPQKIGAGSVTK